MSGRVPTRRAVLGTLALAVCGGCTRSDGGEGTPTTDAATTAEPSATPDVTPGAGASTASPTTTPGSADFDLREANVLAVEVTPTGGGHRFSVTLQHDDDGEDGYANWWVVEALDGTELGRRPLAHSHGNEPFTRSTTVDVGDRSCVVVRGHDQTHGYGGRAAVVAVRSGVAGLVDQGSERRAIMAGTCP